MLRREFCSYDKRCSEVEDAINIRLNEVLYEQRAALIPPRNHLAYRHGIRWRMLGSSDPDVENETKIASHEQQIDYRRIVENDLSLLANFFVSIQDAMREGLRTQMYETIETATKASGNVADQSDYESPAHAFLEGLRMIEFGVDPEGKVSVPEVHMTSEQARLFFESADELGDEFRLKVENLTKQKEKNALETERIRLERFRTR